MTLEAFDRGAPAYGHAKSCAADTCGAAVEPKHLMCRTHWFSVPRDLREALLGANSRARRTRSAEDQARYQDLLTRAVDIADGLGARS